MEMQPIEWSSSFETGNPVIDGQHRELLACLGEIVALMSRGNGERTYAECLNFRRLFEAHFSDEERILSKAEFSRLPVHVASHEEIREYLNTLFSTCLEACRGNCAGPCMPDLASVMIHHFLDGDLDFKSFLQAKGLANGNH
jgi:hemerythrin-like metal-binding protein